MDKENRRLSFRLISSLSMRALTKAFLCLATLFPFTVSAQVLPQEPTRVEGEYLIRYGNGIHNSEGVLLSASVGFETIERIEKFEIDVVKEPEQRKLDSTAIKQMLASGIISFIEPNFILKSSARTPNDPRYSEQWGLHNTGGKGGTSDVDIDAPEAWELTTGGESILIGIIDSGIDIDHTDLVANLWVNPNEIPDNGLDDDGNGVIDDVNGYNAISNSGKINDDNGHGTHVAGIAAAAGNNSTGVSGTSWNSKIVGIKFLTATGEGSTSDAIKAIEYAVSLKQAGHNLRVLNASWGGNGLSTALQSAIQSASDNGILFVTAAGNEAANNDSINSYPANYPVTNVVSVASLDRNGNLSTFSNYGQSKVHIAAPGSDILSTYFDGSYASISGTSMASPMVAGVAALVASREPSISVSQLKSRLLNTAKPLSTLTGLIKSGGMVSAYRALTSASTPGVTMSEVHYSSSSPKYSFYEDLGSMILSADDATTTITLPFNFKFYNAQFSSLSISSNGRIVPISKNTSNALSGDYNNSAAAGINVLNDDYVPSSVGSTPGGVWYKTTSDTATISWIVQPYAKQSSNDPTTEIVFQAVLSSNGNIRINYKDTDVGDSSYDVGASATVSIAPVTGTSGIMLTVSHNTAKPSLLGTGKSLLLKQSGSYTYSDFDGDGKSDLIVWRPSTGMWYVLSSGSGFDPLQSAQHQLGLTGDIPMVGDFDGDRKADLCVWRPSNGTWYFRTSMSGYSYISSMQWGLNGDIPIVGDTDGDYISDISVYRPSNGTFYTLLSSTGFNRTGALSNQEGNHHSVTIGGSGFDPLIGDLTGDGIENYTAVWQLSRFWNVSNSAGQIIYSLPWGIPGDTPRICHHDNDNIADRLMVRTESNNLLSWYFVLGNNSGASSYSFGSLGDNPACKHDLDGDGSPELLVFRAQTGEWFSRSAGDDSTVIKYSFGLPGDIAMVQ